MTAAATLRQVMAALAALADADDGVARAALGLLMAREHGAGCGVDDSEALRDVERIAASGRKREAAGIVAAKLAAYETASPENIARRLRRQVATHDKGRPTAAAAQIAAKA
jgi:hypothetical protein